METLAYWKFPSDFGPLTLVASDRGLALVQLPVNGRSPGLAPLRAMRRFRGSRWRESRERLDVCVSELREYFAGKRREFKLPLDLRGTGFQRCCWEALLTIPYGETRSYAEIAQLIGKPSASRAVGMANHANPLPIVVPCHRVVASDGSLAGYAGGLEMKRKLLALESGTLARAKGGTGF